MNGFQHEQPDYWLTFGNPWEIERLNVAYPIKFYGHVSVCECVRGQAIVMVESSILRGGQGFTHQA